VMPQERSVVPGVARRAKTGWWTSCDIV